MGRDSLRCLPAKATQLSQAFVIVLLVLGFSTATAQQTRVPQALDTAKALSQFIQDSWRIEDGLLINSILDQVKTPDGYHWLATYDGLIRFDGWSFKVYSQRTHPQFPTNSIYNLLGDRAGNLWIATNGGGVLKKSGEDITLVETNQYMPNNSVTTLIEDENGAIWVGTRGGLGMILNNTYAFYPEFDRLKDLHVFKLYIDSKGALWIGTLGEGLWQLQNGLLRQYTTKNGLSNNSIRSLFEDAKGRLWIGTEEGISLMENDRIRSVSVFDGNYHAFINDIIQDAYGTLWFATDAGLLRHHNDRFDLYFTDPEGGANELLNLHADEQGSLWIGTYHKGLIRLRDGKFKNYSLEEGLPNEVANVVWPEKEGGAWVGTNGGIAFVHNEVQRVYQLADNQSANRIRDIYRDSKGILWAATYNGLFRFNGKGFVRAMYKGAGLSSDKVRRIMEDRQGRLWIGTRNGLFVQNTPGVERVSIVDELSGVFVLSIFVDSKGLVWVSTNGKGLYCFKDSQLIQYTTQNGLSSDIIFDLWEDKQGNLWACSNAGISMLKDGIWHNLGEKEGLFGNTFFQILADEQGYLWITSNRGIFMVSQQELQDMMLRKTDRVPAYKHFTVSDGMRSGVISSVSTSRIDAEGRMWFTTLDGISIIHPERISTNTTPPHVVLESVVVDNVAYAANAPVKFEAGMRQYAFSYTGFNYSAPKATTFAYKLEGFDRDWQLAGTRRTAYYTNLPAGSYTFKVRAANEDGIWSEEDATFTFEQKAHFWDTLWFKLLMVAGSVLLGFIIYLGRAHQLKVQNQKLASLVSERTEHINTQKQAIEKQKEELTQLNQLKDQLLSVLSHDLRQPFSSISGLLSLLREKQIDQHEFQDFSKELNQQVKWQVHMLDNVLLWTRNQLKGLEVNPVQVPMHEFVEDICQLYRSQALQKNIRIINQVEHSMQVMADVDILHLLLRNLLGNAIKFTRSNGIISISAHFYNDFCQVEVADDGIGIERERLASLFDAQVKKSKPGTSNEKGTGLGLVLCREFIEACGGRIWAESQPGRGSRFIFWLPQGVGAAGIQDMKNKQPLTS
ncbi:sensor histidine kinase [Cesiribacter andamanensis]|uniref:histidine kinase n=1 Tax=Cesiribacter andamanensis AMV16 TaxID=1279009 RepID=M7NB12_9BACT|nr:sensor histidine kinase [Cesiribacter andamanensis]EMR04462.1 Adaptive-response sensory-kinase sasA [Cesiribacter andamanensis AMV16]